MSKKRRKIDERQLSLLDLLREMQERPRDGEETMKCVDRLRAAMRAAVKGSPLSIAQIAGELSHRTGASITKDQIYSWTRESDEQNGRPSRHVPAEYLPAFCSITGSNDPLMLLGETAGLFVVRGPEALRAEIRKLDEDAARIQQSKKKRIAFLREMEG